MTFARSLVRIGGRRIVIARRAPTVAGRLAAAGAQHPSLPRSASKVHLALSKRAYQVAAAARGNDGAQAIGFPRSAAPVQASADPADIVARLGAIRDVLEDEVGGSAQGVEVVNQAARDVQTPRAARMGVWGDPLASPSTFVSALLADPLSEDTDTATAVLERHSSGPGSCVIRHSEREGAESRDGAVDGQIPWLRDAQVDVVEVLAASPAAALSQLLATDFPVLTLDPIRMLEAPGMAEVLTHLIQHPYLRLVINGPVPSSPAASSSSSIIDAAGSEAARSRLERQLRAYTHRALASDIAREAIFVDARAGMQAAAALRDALVDESGLAGRQRGTEWATYQARFMESNMGEARAVLGSAVRRVQEVTGVQTDAETFRAIQERTAGYVASAALAQVQAVLGHLEDEVDRANDAASALRRMADETAKVAHGQLTDAGDVAEHLTQGRRAIQGVWEGKLAWWRVVIGGGAAEGSVDELEQAVRGRWAVDLGNRLSYDAGVLGSMQADLSSRVDAILNSFSPSAPRSALQPPANSPTHPFHSALLNNALARLSAQNTISPALLLPPVQQRRDQLLATLIPAVQRAGTRLLWQTYSLTFLAASLSWSATVPLGFVSGSTGWATFLLLAAGTARWSVGCWARAQKAFWKGWDRIEAGLEDDVRASLGSVVQGRLVGKADAAARGLETLVQARRARIEGVRAKVERLTLPAVGSGRAA